MLKSGRSLIFLTTVLGLLSTSSIAFGKNGTTSIPVKSGKMQELIQKEREIEEKKSEESSIENDDPSVESMDEDEAITKRPLPDPQGFNSGNNNNNASWIKPGTKRKLIQIEADPDSSDENPKENLGNYFRYSDDSEYVPPAKKRKLNNNNSPNHSHSDPNSDDSENSELKVNLRNKPLLQTPSRNSQGKISTLGFSRIGKTEKETEIQPAQKTSKLNRRFPGDDGHEYTLEELEQLPVKTPYHPDPRDPRSQALWPIFRKLTPEPITVGGKFSSNQRLVAVLLNLLKNRGKFLSDYYYVYSKDGSEEFREILRNSNMKEEDNQLSIPTDLRDPELYKNLFSRLSGEDLRVLGEYYLGHSLTLRDVKNWIKDNQDPKHPKAQLDHIAPKAKNGINYLYLNGAYCSGRLNGKKSDQKKHEVEDKYRDIETPPASPMGSPTRCQVPQNAVPQLPAVYEDFHTAVEK